MGRSCRGGAGLWLWGRGQGRRCIPPFRLRLPAAASAFRPAPAVGAPVAAFHRPVALVAPEAAMSGPNGDLGVPVEAGAEGEDDGFGEAGDWGGGLEGLPAPKPWLVPDL